MQEITNSTQWPLVSKPFFSLVPSDNGDGQRAIIISGINSVQGAVKMASILGQGLTQGVASPYMPLAKAGHIAIVEVRVGKPGQEASDVYRNTPPVASASLLVRQDGRVVIDFIRGERNRELYVENGDNSNSPIAQAMLAYVDKINERGIPLISEPHNGAFRLVEEPVVQNTQEAEVPPSTNPIVNAAQAASQAAATAFSALRNAVRSRISSHDNAAAAQANQPVEQRSHDGYEMIDYSGCTREWPIIAAEYAANGLIVAPVQNETMLRELALRTENRMMWPNGREVTIAALMAGTTQIAALFKDTGAAPTIDDVVGYAVFVPRGDKLVAQAVKARHELPPTQDMLEICNDFATGINNGSIPSYLPIINGKFPVVDGRVVDGDHPATPQYDENGVLKETTATPYYYAPSPTLRAANFADPVQGFATTDGRRVQPEPLTEHDEDEHDEEEGELTADDDEVTIDDVAFPTLRILSEPVASGRLTSASINNWLPTQIGSLMSVKLGSFRDVLERFDDDYLSESLVNALREDGFCQGLEGNEGVHDATLEDDENRKSLTGLYSGRYLPVTLDGLDCDIHAIMKIKPDNTFALVEAVADGQVWSQDELNDRVKSALSALRSLSELQAQVNYQPDAIYENVSGGIKALLTENGVTVKSLPSERTAERNAPEAEM